MGEKGNKRGENRLRVVPHFSAGIIQRAKRERALKSPHAACRLFSCRVILTRARVSLALLSVRKNWGLLVVQGENVNQPVISHHQTISPPRKRLAISQLATKQHFPVLKNVACVQTSPLPQKNREKRLLPNFSEGGGTSVHSL